MPIKPSCISQKDRKNRLCNDETSAKVITICHSEGAERPKNLIVTVNTRFFTPLRSVQNDRKGLSQKSLFRDSAAVCGSFRMTKEMALSRLSMLKYTEAD